MSTEKKEPVNQISTFSEYMSEFLAEKGARTVVEIGADVQLKLALGLSLCCDQYFCVNFPEDIIRMEGWYEMHQKMGMDNVELIGANALELSRHIPHADVIILHNVLLDLTGEDTDLLWKYRRGEAKYSPEQLEELNSRFAQAAEQGYREFLRVANPGYIVTFKRLDVNNRFRNFLLDTLEIDPSKLECKELLSDECEEMWIAFIIDNTKTQ